jgi:hypothetical protein
LLPDCFVNSSVCFTNFDLVVSGLQQLTQKRSNDNMKIFGLSLLALFCFLGAAFADPPIPQSSTVVNLQFGPVVQSSDGSTPITGLLTGATVAATGGSTTTITTATIGYAGQYIVFGSSTATTALRSVAFYVTAVSGSGPYTLTVAPTLPASPTSSDTYNQTNIGVLVSKDGSAWATPSGALTETGKGYYYIAANATDTNTIGPLKVHWDVYGSTAGISNESSPGFVIATNPYNATNGGFAALPNTVVATNGSLLTAGTGTSQLNPSGGTFTGVGLAATQTGVTIPAVTSVTGSVGSVSSAITLPANAPTTFLANETTVQGIASGTTANGTSIFAVNTKLGTPVGASVSADIATANSSLTSLAATVGAINTNTAPATYYIAGSHTTTGTAETLTQQQEVLLADSELVGDHTETAVISNLQTDTYYLLGRAAVSANITEVVTVNTATGQVVSRLITQPFPTGTGS